MTDSSAGQDVPPESPESTRPSAQRGAWAANDGTQVARKADVTKRFVAFLIDGVIAFVLSRIPFLGGILAGLYILLRDGFDYEFMDHRSIGKRLMRLRPIADDGSPITLAVSARRNWPLAVTSLAIILLLVPVLGWLLIPFAWVAGLILLILEAYFTLTDQQGLRWGDRLAGTRVVETDA